VYILVINRLIVFSFSTPFGSKQSVCCCSVATATQSGYGADCSGAWEFQGQDQTIIKCAPSVSASYRPVSDARPPRFSTPPCLDNLGGLPWWASVGGLLACLLPRNTMSSKKQRVVWVAVLSCQAAVLFHSSHCGNSQRTYGL